MSRFINSIPNEREGITMILQTEDGNYHYVDGAYIKPIMRLFEADTRAYEVMSFPYDKEKEKVTSWGEEFSRFYGGFQEMITDMSIMVEGLENYIESEEEIYEAYQI